MSVSMSAADYDVPCAISLQLAERAFPGLFELLPLGSMPKMRPKTRAATTTRPATDPKIAFLLGLHC